MVANVPPQMPTARALAARYYTDPDVFRDELEHWFGTHWVCVGRADQLAERGEYVLREIAGESLMIVRDGSGVLGAFFNLCRHRGTRLCTATEGRFGATIQCPYHAWTYDLSGRLVGAPHTEDVAGFRKDDWPLHRAALELWDGHIFINLGDEPKPFDGQLDGLPEKFRSWDMEQLRLGARIVYDVAANWKLIVQNYSECLHCPIIHPALQRLSHYLSGINEAPRPHSLGGWMDLRDGIETLSRDGKRRRACLPGLNVQDRRRVYYYAILPNLLLSLHPDYVMTHTLWPLACDRTRIDCQWHFHPVEIQKPDFDPGDAVEFWDLTNRQDWQVCELSQLGLKSRRYRPGPYAEREGLLHDFDRLIVSAQDDEGRGPLSG